MSWRSPRGRGGENWRLSLVPFPLPPLLYAADLPSTLPADNLNNRKLFQKPRSMPAPTITLPVPTPSRPLPLLSTTRRSFPSY